MGREKALLVIGLICFIVPTRGSTDCSDGTCLNDKTHVETWNIVNCICKEGFTGPRCEVNIDEDTSSETVDEDSNPDSPNSAEGEQGSIRLPDTIWPTFYNIKIKADDPVVDENGNKDHSYDCETTIYLNCTKDTEDIRIHGVGHTLNSVNLYEIDSNGDGESLDTSMPTYDAKKEWYVIPVDDGLVSGHNYILKLKTTGTITGGYAGLYRSSYTENGKKRYILTTMMEPTDARRVFPCFDEPDFKAIFTFDIIRRENETSLTNLPLRKTVRSEDFDGYFVDTFDEPRTVPMSTYLVAISIGDLAHKEAERESDGDTLIRTWSRSSAVNQTECVLDLTVKAMSFFEDYFQIKYHLPKQDAIAVPEMSFNAMEHWGLITYREEAMLIDPEDASAMDKEWAAILVAHEVSHQWFGNLVSPYWWDDLWLNEGFATYMMFLATEHIYPDWQMMTQMAVNYRGLQNVMVKDSSLASHPVYVDVNHPNEIKEIFDLISYAKGAALIRMMNAFLGETTFRSGLTRYLTDLSYKTATHNDLWYALGNQSLADGNQNTDVKTIMDAWILEKNYPLVYVSRHEDGTLTLSQTPFLFLEEERAQRGHVCWNVPFVYTTDSTLNFDMPEPRDVIWMKDDCSNVTISTTGSESNHWILANVQQIGYFRVSYDVDNWIALFDQLQKDHLVIHPINRAQLISDSNNLARAELLDRGLAMKAFQYLHKERHYTPWRAAIREIQLIDNLLKLSPVYGNFKNFIRAKLEAPYLMALTADRTHYTIKLLALLATQACKYGVTSCVNDANTKFKAWMRNQTTSKLDPNLKEVIYCVGVRHGGEEAVHFLLDLYQKTDSALERMKLVAALSCTETPWIVQMLGSKLIEADRGGLTTSDVVSLIEQLSQTAIGRLIVPHFLQEHWDAIYKTYGQGLNMFSRLITFITSPMNTETELDLIKRIINTQTSLGTGRRAFYEAVQRIRNQIKTTKALEEIFKDGSSFLDPTNSL